MKKNVLLLLLGFWLAHGAQAQGNYVFSGGEAANYGTVDLATPGGQSWATNRSASPGYFSAVGASPYSNPTDANNINGYVKHYVTAANQGYTFPVGTGSDVRLLTTSGTIANNSTFATAWILGDPNSNLDPTTPNSGAHSTTATGAGITSVSKVGQWDWQDISGTGAGVTVTVSIPDQTYFATAANLRLVGWNGTAWQNLSGNTGASGNTENSTLGGTMVAGITAIGIGSVTVVILPLDLLSFTATESNCSAALSWATAREVNTGYFEVQQSTDGVNFLQVGQVTAQGNGMGKTYNYTTTQNAGLSYYRLKVVDKNGDAKYSAIISLRTNCSSNGHYIKLFPNPVVTGTGMVSLSFDVAYKGAAQVVMTNGNGQRIMSRNINITDGANTFRFSSSIVTKGAYFLLLTDATGKQLGSVQKFIKL